MVAVAARARTGHERSRLSWWAAGLVAAVLLLLSPGSITGADGPAAYEAGRSLVVHHDLTVPAALGFPGRGGDTYATHGLALPLVAAAAYVVTLPVAHLAPDPGRASEALVAGVMPLVGGLLVLALQALCRRLGASPRTSLLTAVGAVCGTYLLPYLKDFYSEPLAVLLVVVAVERALAGAPVAAGTAAGLAGLTRPNLLALVPLLVVVLGRRLGRRAALESALPAVVATGLVLGYDVLRWGDPFQVDPLQGGVSLGRPFLHATAGLLWHPQKSVVLFAPAVLVLGPALVWAWRRRRDAAVLLGGNLLLVAGVAAAWPSWGGGWSWGPRLLLPGVVPALALLAPWVEHRPARARVTGGLLLAGALVSLPGLLVSTRAQLADHPPQEGPSAWRQAGLVLPAARSTALHLAHPPGAARSLDLWQVEAARTAGGAGLALAAVGTVLLAGTAVAAGAGLTRAWQASA